MDRQKVAKEAIANFDKAHPNSSSEAKNFYISGWLDGVQEFYVIMKKLRDLYEEASIYMRSQEELQEMGEKYYQYTGIDEVMRIRYIWYTNEQSTYMSSEFVKRME